MVTLPPYVPRRGDVVWIAFDPQAGHEQAGRRPAVVLSPVAYNRKVGLALLCPITSQAKGYPFEVALPSGLPITGGQEPGLAGQGCQACLCSAIGNYQRDPSADRRFARRVVAEVLSVDRAAEGEGASVNRPGCTVAARRRGWDVGALVG